MEGRGYEPYEAVKYASTNLFKTIIIMMTIFFILYFATIYLLVAVYPFFVKGMVQLVNDLSRIAQFIILFVVTSICLIVKKWRKRKNNG